MSDTQPQDRPPYGRLRRECLAALVTPSTPGEAAIRLGWERDRTASWVHNLVRVGLVQRVAWRRTPAGQIAGVYQRVTP